MSHEETPFVKGIVNFAIESLVFQNKLLNSAHSIWDTNFLDITKELLEEIITNIVQINWS